MLIRRYFNFLADPDVAIDLGTATTRVFVVNRGVVAEQPTRVLPDDGAALQSPAAPLRGGVVRDIAATARLLEPLLRRARRLGLIKPRAVVCAPSDANATERADLIEAVRRSGASDVKILPEPLASAVGAGLDIASSYAQMLVDIGDGVTDLAVIRARRLVSTRTTRHAAGDLRVALQTLVRQRDNLYLRQREAERLVQQYGADGAATASRPLSAVALDSSGAAVSVELQPDQICAAVGPGVGKIVALIQTALRDLPPDLAVEVLESGICLSGGGACLRGMDRLIARETGAEVRVPTNPLRAAINGAGEILTALSQTSSWDADW